MHSYDVEANGLSELAEESDEDSGSGGKRTSFEDKNGRKRTTSMNGEGRSYGPPRRKGTLESERIDWSKDKSFDQLKR